MTSPLWLRRQTRSASAQATARLAAEQFIRLSEVRDGLRRIPNGRNVLNVGSVWLQSFGIIALATWIDHPIGWIAAFLLMGRAFALYAILGHEAAHRLLFSNRRANDLIGKDRPAAIKMVSKFLKMPPELTTELMPKVEYDMDWQPRSIDSIQVAEKQLADQKKLKAPLDLNKYVYLDLLKAVRPQNVQITR